MLGIDIGTQSIRTQLFDVKGKCVGAESIEQYMDTVKPGWATQKPEFWWECVTKNINQLLKNAEISPKNIVSVGCCAVMHSPVPVTKDGEVLEKDVQLYCDKRAAHIADDLASRENEDSIFEKTANVPTSNWFGIKLKWIKDNEPKIYKEAYKFVTPNAFINYKLTGEACIDPSEASGTYMMDKDTMKWSVELINQLGLDEEKLPKICKAYDIIGNISEKAAKETGLAVGTPVVAGGGDMFCSLITSGLTKNGSVVDLTGTGSVITLLDKAPVMDGRVMNLAHVMDGWVAFGCIDSSGGAFRWFRDNLAKKETEYARANGMDEYAYMSDLASETEYGAQGVMFYPYLMGERSLGTADSRALFIGMNSGTKTGHMVRAILEGIAFEHKRTLDILESNSNNGIEKVYHTGGGAKGDLWSQIKADIYGKPVYTLKATEGGVLGAALLGGVGVGIYNSVLEAAELVTEIDKEFLPDKSKAERYNAMFNQYCKIHDLLMDSFVEMAKLP